MRGKNWFAAVAFKGAAVVILEITDYEVRRELLRAGKDRGIGWLDALKDLLRYAPITTPVMLRASEFRASARNMGRQSAIDETVIAATNVHHLGLFARAGVWGEIRESRSVIRLLQKPGKHLTPCYN